MGRVALRVSVDPGVEKQNVEENAICMIVPFVLNENASSKCKRQM